MIRVFKILISTCLGLGLLILLIINYNLYRIPEIKNSTSYTVNIDLLKQLQFIEQALNKGADAEMQELYPEGHIFMNALYGLTWCNVIAPLGRQDSLYQKGHEQIQQAFNNLNSEVGRLPFDNTLPLPYGAFYNGWNNYLLGRKLSIENPMYRNSLEVNQFKQQCDSISSILKEETYPASYVGGVWPADAMVCAASLTLHDQIFGSRYQEILKNWTKRVRESLDNHGLIPHAINYSEGTIAEHARGSSQSLMLIFLKEIDPQFAAEQFKVYQSYFLDTRLGLSGVREYPKGETGHGDVDSGPVILQMGGAATIVGIQATSLFNDSESSKKINGTIEALTFPYQTKSEKSYLFKSLPIADVFIAWARSGQTPDHNKRVIFLQFHLFSLLLSALISGAIWWLWRRSKK